MTAGIAGKFTTVDDTEDVSWFIRFSDTVNAMPEHRGTRQALVNALSPLERQHVLDVGSGPGDDTRTLAELAGPEGRVVGLDLSEAMLTEARRRGGPVEFMHGDVHALPFADDTFDRVRAKLVRMHCPDIDRADDELIRVLKPGGKLAVFDFDFETFTLDHPDKVMTRAIARHWTDHHTQEWCGRQTRRRFLMRGMTDVTITPRTVQIPYDFFRTLMVGTLAEAVATGALDVSPEEWWRPLTEAAEVGQFFATLTGFVVGATKLPTA